MYTLLFFLCRNENTDCTYIQPLRKSESAYGTRCLSYSGNRHHRYLYPKAESFTGSMATYSEKELKTVGNQNVLQSLKVLDPSFIVLENNLSGSDPNATMNLNIGGNTNIVGLETEYTTNPNQPLFILDGFETTLSTITDLSMDRVASITILKDAASTAIYGAKAANGVVVVETKNRKPEDYNSTTTVTLVWNGPT